MRAKGDKCVPRIRASIARQRLAPPFHSSFRGARSASPKSILPIVFINSGLSPPGCPGMTSAYSREDRFKFQKAKTVFHVVMHTFASSPHAFPRGSIPVASPPKRAHGMTGLAPCASMGSCARWSRRRTRAYRSVTGYTRHSPRNGLTAYFVLSPEIGLVCLRRRQSGLLDLTPASRRQDHTTSPSASGALVLSAACVHRIPPRVDDDAPLVGRDGEEIGDLRVKRNIFRNGD